MVEAFHHLAFEDGIELREIYGEAGDRTDVTRHCDVADVRVTVV
jgi:hypothetical protein